MCNSKVQVDRTFEAIIDDVPLTPSTCAHLVNEIIKYLIFHKSQIPYPFHWLRNIVNRKRARKEMLNNRASFSVQKNFQLASTAYDNLEAVMKNIETEFSTSGDDVKEILLVFGTTVYTPKEVVSIRIPKISIEHTDGFHSENFHKNQHKILRKIFLSEHWLESIESPLVCTNTYVLFRKGSHKNLNEFYSPNSEYEISNKAHKTFITLTDRYTHTCCGNIKVFEDQPENDQTVIEDNTPSYWFQATISIKGFKDCFINKVPASELW